MAATHIKTTAILFLVTGFPVPCLASYDSILLNLLDSVVDTTFNSSTAELRIFSDDNDALTLTDSIPLTGTITNTVFDLQTYLDLLVDDPDSSFPIAVFEGGQFSLTFDYDDGFGPQPYFFAGPVDTILFSVVQVGPLSTIVGEGFLPVSWHLPGSNDWPTPRAEIDVLSLVFEDLSDWNWDSDVAGQSSITFSPEFIPEASTIFLFVVALLLVYARRPQSVSNDSKIN